MTDEVLDKVGIWANSLCALHCVLFPVLLPALPLLGATIFAEHWFERAMLIFSIIIGVAAILSGFFRYHRKLYPLYSLGMGALIYWNKDIFGHDFEAAFVIVGAVLIIVAHYFNIRLCRECKSCQEDGCNA